jgi:hypothetical protein
MEFGLLIKMMHLCEEEKDNSNELSDILSETPLETLQKIVNEKTLSNKMWFNFSDIENGTFHYATLLFMACYNLNVENVRVLLTHEKTKNIIDLNCVCTDYNYNLFDCLSFSMPKKEENLKEIFNLLIAHHGYNPDHGAKYTLDSNPQDQNEV